MSRLAVVLLTALLGVNAMAADVIDPNRTKEFGDITVRYNTFTSSFLQPETAQAVGVVRSKNKGLINVSVFKGVTPVAAQVTANLKASLGKSEVLTFTHITEKHVTNHPAPYSLQQPEFKSSTTNVETGCYAPGSSFVQHLFLAN
ncbi:DUF4426 domain-containing protein [Corynebacterium pseudodiphtheriticum]|uniref:DUF4426 domain-containing protein n=1 Tax=Corynebacterium pseudodiphtheriticum TaxID=37637 RepID=UPI000F869075|nr:DUF4426 domain-containing protein [Corynebacterium pseudodiphtheriticum]